MGASKDSVQTFKVSDQRAVGSVVEWSEIC
jgi:hypothetical protein